MIGGRGIATGPAESLAPVYSVREIDVVRDEWEGEGI